MDIPYTHAVCMVVIAQSVRCKCSDCALSLGAQQWYAKAIGIRHRIPSATDGRPAGAASFGDRAIHADGYCEGAKDRAHPFIGLGLGARSSARPTGSGCDGHCWQRLHRRPSQAAALASAVQEPPTVLSRLLLRDRAAKPLVRGEGSPWERLQGHSPLKGMLAAGRGFATKLQAEPGGPRRLSG